MLLAFGCRGSVTFHLMFVHIILISVWVVEWTPFGKEHSVDHMFSLYFDYLKF